MLLAARGRRHPFAAARLLPIPLSSGPSFASSTTTTTSNGACSSSAADPDAVAAEVATLLSRCSGDWRLAVSSSDLPSRLSPAAISSLVRRRPSPSSPRLHPKLLLDFFYWSSPQLAPSAPAPDAFAHLAMSLCAGSLFNLANGLLIKMIRAYPSPPVVLASIHRALSDSGHRSPAVLDVLVDTYKKSGRVQDAAEVVLMMRDRGMAPSIRCCNALLKDLLRADAMALLWKVREFMVGAGISPDVYTYSTLIEAYCKVREFDTAKKVLVEMRERGCGLNTVTYNVLIAGLCRSGAVEEAFGFKKDMEDYGLVPDGRHHHILNKVVFTVFAPSLMFASLAKTVTFSDRWFMPINIGITFMAGGTLGWIACKILKPPQHFRGMIIAFCSAGNLGNLLLIVVPAVRDEDGNPFRKRQQPLPLSWALLFIIVHGSWWLEAPLLSGESEIAKKGSWTTTNLKDTIHHVVEELMAPPTLSAILGFVFGLVPWLKSLVIGDGAPLRVIQDSIQLMGNGTIPCVSLILGGNLIKGLRKLEFKHTVIIAIVCIRYMILPLVGIAVVHGAYWVGFLPHDPLYRYVLMMQFALPPAMTIGTMAQLFDVAQEECSVIFLWTYLVSSISLTTWSMIFMSIPSLGQSAMISAFQLTQREEVEDNNTPLEKSRSN
ncbi:hypothetical protein DAI22_07g108733 [Oryza sativa Japonica Group]|nr:hypothetical protein DAI22_07g108733 [Oryza sativa Japonica Group]